MMSRGLIAIVPLLVQTLMVSASTPCTWKTYRNSYIAMNTNERIKNLTIAECQTKCSQAVNFKCATIDYDRINSICHLSNLTYENGKKMGLLRNSSQYDLIVCTLEVNTWKIDRCDSGTKSPSRNYVLLDGTFGSASAQQHCQALGSKLIKNDYYEISVDVRNKQGWRGINSGHPGILFNAKDSNNYDMVYFRPHSVGGCYQTGFKVNGKWRGIKTGRCQSGPPKGGIWFNIKVKVMKSYALIYLDNKLVVTYKPHYSARGQGGVFVWLGYNNIAEFKNYKIYAIPKAEPGAWRVSNCDSDTQSLTHNSIVLDGTFGTASAQQQCQALGTKVIPGAHYEISVHMLNTQGWRGINSGHPGVLFNAIDSDNYDMVYFRPHSVGGCYQTGYKAKGKWKAIKTGSCPGGPPRGGSWFNVKVKVINSKAYVILNDRLVISYTPHYSAKGQGGVFVWLGYNNIAQFTNYKISTANSDSWLISQCDAGTKSPSLDYVLLDGTFGRASAQQHCQAVGLRVIPGTKYEISAEVKNLRGWRGINSGHPGVLFNAKDSSNFDMVYFRPHSVGGCYQTGYKVNGKWRAIKTGSCQGGPPKGGIWFNIKVKVINSQASVYLDNKLVITYTPHYSAKGQGGVFVWLGYNNIAEFKDFKIRAI